MKKKQRSNTKEKSLRQIENDLESQKQTFTFLDENMKQKNHVGYFLMS